MVLAIGGAAAFAGPAAANHIHYGDAQDRAEYLERVSVPRMVEHLEAFQRIADANGGTRASGTPGYLQSVRYVTGKLRAAGYRPTVQAFPFDFFRQLAPSTLERVGPSPRTYSEGADFATQDYSGSGDVTAPLQAVDLVLPPGPTAGSSNSGCEDADFAGFKPGNIALLQRGTCTFGEKAANAAEAGASAVIVFNEGQPGRTGVLGGTAGAPQPIPVLDTSFDVGAELASQLASGPVTMHVVTSTESESRKTYNVIADSNLGVTNGRKTIVVGSHLDSVIEGPGINDNGSGSALNLELARQLHRIGAAHRTRVRFAFWGAEESGLLGSTHYVSQLTPKRIADIKANLNFDMVASPNGVSFVYDGDGSDTTPAGPAGSDQIEQDLIDAFGAFPTAPTQFSGRSDYGPFIAVGVPAGGIFTGAEGIKTPEQAAIFGGTAGIAYDPCYHQACDTLENATGPLSLELLSRNSQAAAAVVFDYANASTFPGEGAAERRAAARSGRATDAGRFEYRGGHLAR